MAKREKQKRYSLEFREMAVRRMKLGDNVSQLSRELGVDRTLSFAKTLSVDKESGIAPQKFRPIPRSLAEVPRMKAIRTEPKTKLGVGATVGAWL